jgi:subtilisin family serine protease
MLSFPLIVISVLGSQMVAGTKVDARLAEQLQHLSPNEQILAWVFLTDKGSNEFKKSSVPRSVVAERSYLRRLKVRSAESAVDYSDLPVERSYVEQIAAHVIQVRQVSKWFNGVSVRATREQLGVVESLPFVRRLESLTRMRRTYNHEGHSQTPSPEEETRRIKSSTFDQSLYRTTSLDYGLSFNQVNMINVPAVHNMGNYGQGVVIGVLDNGFRLMNHESFDTLRPRIIATYDYVDKKVSVVPNNPSPSHGFHGMYILSALAGYKPGQVIGPAFGASFILARTENDSSETPFEEDNWLAAIEWMDSIGVDITTTSLGYLAYDPPYPSWTWDQMNGNTTVITRAADMAVSKGIVVLNSAGNNGLNTSRNTLNAPADGDSVLSIGALRTDGERASFSSVGPTTSTPPRIKPDLMAQGVSVWCASHVDTAGYITQQGTSLSTPLAAGAAALLLHAHPTLTPLEVADALKRTASNANAPNNLVGWGTIDVLAAINSVGGGTPSLPTAFKFLSSSPNPFNPSTSISFKYALSQPANVSLKIFNLLGQEVRTLIEAQQAAGTPFVVWNAKSNSGDELPSGVYFARLVAAPTSGGAAYRESARIVLLR